MLKRNPMQCTTAAQSQLLNCTDPCDFHAPHVGSTKMGQQGEGSFIHSRGACLPSPPSKWDHRTKARRIKGRGGLPSQSKHVREVRQEVLEEEISGVLFSPSHELSGSGKAVGLTTLERGEGRSHRCLLSAPAKDGWREDSTSQNTNCRDNTRVFQKTPISKIVFCAQI